MNCLQVWAIKRPGCYKHFCMSLLWICIFISVRRIAEIYRNWFWSVNRTCKWSRNEICLGRRMAGGRTHNDTEVSVSIQLQAWLIKEEEAELSKRGSLPILNLPTTVSTYLATHSSVKLNIMALLSPQNSTVIIFITHPLQHHITYKGFWF